MSPTEFSNYIKQRAIQQQQLHHHNHNNTAAPQTPNHFGTLGPVSPARSLSPNPLSIGIGQNAATADPFYFPSMNSMGYQQYNGHRNIFDTHFHQDSGNGGGIFGGGQSKFSSYLEPQGFFGMRNNMQQQQQQQQQSSQSSPKQQQQQQLGGGSSTANSPQQTQHNMNLKLNTGTNGSTGVLNKYATASNEGKDLSNNATCNNASNSGKLNAITVTLSSIGGNQESTQQQQQQTHPPQNSPIQATATTAASPIQDTSNSSASKLLVDGLNSFYSNNPGTYQQLLVAN